jgi:hypothetical protein
VKSKKSFYRSKFDKLKFKLGSINKAKVAIANRLARVVYKIMSGGEKYKDLGYKRGKPLEQKVIQLVRQLEYLGMNVSFQDHESIVVSRHLVVEKSGIVLT